MKRDCDLWLCAFGHFQAFYGIGCIMVDGFRCPVYRPFCAGTRAAPRDALIAASADEKNRGKAFRLEGVGDN
jgi:hypothetical protein